MSERRATTWMTRLRRHFTGNVVGYLALFVALGGTASAAVIVSSNSQVGPHVIAGASAPSGTTKNVIPGTIGQGDVADHAITNTKIRSNAVDSPRIVDGSVASPDLATGAVTTDKIPDGNVTLNKIGADVQRRIDFSGAVNSNSQVVQTDYGIGNWTITPSCWWDGSPYFDWWLSNQSGTTTRATLSEVSTPLGGGAATPRIDDQLEPSFSEPIG